MGVYGDLKAEYIFYLNVIKETTTRVPSQDKINQYNAHYYRAAMCAAVISREKHGAGYMVENVHDEELISSAIVSRILYCAMSLLGEYKSGASR